MKEPEPNKRVCDKMSHDLIDYLDRRLDAAQTTEMENHIAECDRCREEIKGFKDILTCLPSDSNPGEYYFNSFLPRLKERIEMDRPGFLKRWFGVSSAGLRLWPATVAAVCLLIALAFVLKPSFLGVKIGNSSRLTALNSDSASYDLDESSLCSVKWEILTHLSKAISNVTDSEQVEFDPLPRPALSPSQVLTQDLSETEKKELERNIKALDPETFSI